jgi:hypothetical protein
MYAQSFTSTLSGPSSESHIAALHQSLIPNWTSAAFAKFVDACRGLVDDLANSPTIANGKEEFQRCEMAFRQVCWLAERFWPDVDGMGDEDDSRLAVQLQGAAAAATAASASSAATVPASDAAQNGATDADADPDADPDTTFGSVLNGGQDTRTTS